TNAAVTWQPAAWTQGAAGEAERTPDLTPIIQEIVDRGGWVSGNSLALIISGSGRRNAVSWNGDRDAAPLLTIVYTAPVSGVIDQQHSVLMPLITSDSDTE